MSKTARTVCIIPNNDGDSWSHYVDKAFDNQKGSLTLALDYGTKLVLKDGTELEATKESPIRLLVKRAKASS